MTKLIRNTTYHKLVSQSRQGIPGPSGSGVGVKQGYFRYDNPINGEEELLSYSLYDMDIDGLYELKTLAGTITVTFRINGAAVTGLTNIAVTTTPQNITATAANAVVEGDRLSVSLTNNSSAEGLSFVMKATA